MLTNKLKGVITPMVCPYLENGQINHSAVESLTEFLISKGVQGLYPCGTTGEMLLLSIEERKQLTETVIKKVDKRVLVYVQVGTLTLKDTINLAEHAYKSGADGIGVVTPSFFKISDKALIKYYVQVANSVPDDFPVYLYGIPQCAGNDISSAVASEIAKQCKNVIGIKYSFPDMNKILSFINIRDGQFSVLCGPDQWFYLTVCAGGDGTISGNSNVIPEHFVAISNALNKGNFELARKIQKRTNELCSILSQSNNIARYKAVLKLRGIDCGGMRSPLISLTEDEETELYNDLNNKNYTEVIIDDIRSNE